MVTTETNFAKFIEGECSTCNVDLESFSTFLKVNEAKKRFLSVVTSGGTRVALEKQMVRSLENFSTGLRGARITECLIDDRRYAVVFLMRRGSKLPYARHYTIQQFIDSSLFRPLECGVHFGNEVASAACQRLRDSIVEKRLMVIEYESVQEYLFTLYRIANLSARFGERVMFCLAAAVSDYFIPQKELSTDKLPSTNETLTITLRKVPKCLALLSTKWAPKAFVISFKVRSKFLKYAPMEMCNSLRLLTPRKARNRSKFTPKKSSSSTSNSLF